MVGQALLQLLQRGAGGAVEVAVDCVGVCAGRRASPLYVDIPPPSE